MELIPRLPTIHAPSFPRPSPSIVLSSVSLQTSSPIPNQRGGQFRLPLAPSSLLSPGRSPNATLPLSPLSTSCHSVNSHRRPNSSLLYRERSPDHAPLRLATPPAARLQLGVCLTTPSRNGGVEVTPPQSSDVGPATSSGSGGFPSRLQTSDVGPATSRESAVTPTSRLQTSVVGPATSSGSGGFPSRLQTSDVGPATSSGGAVTPTSTNAVGHATSSGGAVTPTSTNAVGRATSSGGAVTPTSRPQTSVGAGTSSQSRRLDITPSLRHRVRVGDPTTPSQSGVLAVAVGDRVVARWLTDKRWYSAVVKKMLKTGRSIYS